MQPNHCCKRPEGNLHKIGAFTAGERSAMKKFRPTQAVLSTFPGSLGFGGSQGFRARSGIRHSRGGGGGGEGERGPFKLLQWT